MKKTLTILACVLLVGALAMSVFAAFDNSKVTATPSATTLHRGETFTVSAVLENTEQIKAATVMMQFSEDVATMTGGKCKVVLSDEFVEITPGSDKPSKTCTFVIGDKDYTEAISGEIFLFQFKVNEDAPYGEVTVTPKASLAISDGVYIDTEGFTINIVCDGEDHDFTEEVVDEAYKASDATCQAKATYYKSCTCGAQGKTTFSSGALLDHDFTEEDTAEQYKKTGATCTEQAVYYHSCTMCGLQGETTFKSGALLNHDFTEEDTAEQYKKTGATCTEQAVYYHSCTMCGLQGETTFKSGALLNHDFTEEDIAEQYKKTGATCTEQAVYYHSCTVCGAQGETTFKTGALLDHDFTEEDTAEQYKKTGATCTEQAVYYHS